MSIDEAVPPEDFLPDDDDVEVASPEMDLDVREREAQAIKGLQTAYKRMRSEIGKVIIGQQDIVDQLLVSLFSRGHCLLVGVPGLAKTLLVSTISQILQLSFRRIQFTPDLMPSDITGTDVLQDDPETGRRTFQFMQGPLFTNILLADEINRTPPKTQAALLEAMQERHVTVGSSTYRLPQPFFVLATQNPIEQEGTYALPEAQLDAFLALTSSGPAFVAVVAEALADGAVAAGLPRLLAQRLAHRTLAGSAALMEERDLHPGQLKDMVSSPAGTTIAGLRQLEKAGLRSALIEAVLAAAQRSRELA